MKRTRIAMPLFLLLSIPLLAACQNAGDRRMYVQGIVGANAVGSGQIEYEKVPEDQEGEASTNLPTAPLLAAAGQQPLLGKEDLHGGVEFGATLTWWNNGLDVYGYSGGSGTVIILDFDNRMWMSDFFVGPYGSLTVGEKIRIYGGLGPTLVWARIDYETEYETQGGQTYKARGSDDDWSWGVYARGGLEFQLDRSNWVGVGARYLETDLSFSELDTKVNLGTWQVYLTFTTKF